MKKFYHVQNVTASSMALAPYYGTKEAAIDAAKIQQASNQKQGYNYDVVVLEAVATIKSPVPAFEVVDIK